MMKDDMGKGMIDNRMVKDNHQEGISRVMQRKGDLMKGQGGKMGEHGKGMGWKRSSDPLTPRKA